MTPLGRARFAGDDDCISLLEVSCLLHFFHLTLILALLIFFLV
jgi:hypothetical protein